MSGQVERRVSKLEDMANNADKAVRTVFLGEHDDYCIVGHERHERRDGESVDAFHAWVHTLLEGGPDEDVMIIQWQK